ncbi:uncharacterized protein LOC101463070 [Ceratitis capitata]|uniref:uncharacterized protein LOC101463070 n=1 Tax=Ceratitis capitata TaxID=7213 RepID=UPI00032A3010|nr:uncharacterized protein LOC101463070 [Ceratitis capitata]
MAEDLKLFENAFRRAHNRITVYEGSLGAYAYESNETVHRGILREDLLVLNSTERIAFITVISFLLAVSLCGNIGALHVNFRRKIRPFFRACLISLAIGDLINTLFLSTAYLSQISNDFLQIWVLGHIMCHLVPFINTAAILVSSITLVGIALDRYFAVMRAVISFWNPGVIFCVLSMLVLWATSIGISWPVFRVYELFPVYILTVQKMPMDVGLNSTATTSADVDILGKVIAGSAATATTNARPIVPALHETFSDTVTQTMWEQRNDANNKRKYAMVITSERVMMCISNQSSIALYYIVIFGIIFVPTIIAFVCINAVIAKQLWKRRKTAMTVNKIDHSRFVEKWFGWCCCGKGLKGRDKEELGTKDNSNEVKPGTTHNFNALADTRIELAPFNVPSATTMQHFILPSNTSHAPPANIKPSNSRESRHIRMFYIVIMLITSFLLLRLPTWIFLITRMYIPYAGHTPIILHYTFGILNITNSVLNPFLYTFLTETIKCANFIKGTFRHRFCGFRLCKQQKQEFGSNDVSQKCDITSDHSTAICCGSSWFSKAEVVSPKVNFESPAKLNTIENFSNY